LENVYKVVVWPLNKNYEHPCDAFMRSIHDQNEVFGKLNIRPNVLECLMNEIKRRLQVPPVRIKADFELTCFK